MTEENKKHERFKEVASKRTGKALDAIYLIGALSSNANMECKEEDVQKIVDALQVAMHKMSDRLSDNQVVEEEFTL